MSERASRGRRYPTAEIIEEGMREGMQIESAAIGVDDKLALLEALSTTGLRTLVVGSFVSPTWTPQMARDRREHYYKCWKKAVTRSLDWVD